MEKTISIKCKASLYIPLSQLNPIQGDLKELSPEDFELLRLKILSQGIRFAFHVWKETKKLNGKDTFSWWIIDGHGRDKVLSVLVEKDGYAEPSIPCVEVQADSLQEAKSLVLDSSSTYHKMTEVGLKAYMLELNLQPVNLQSYRLPIDTKSFETKFFGAPVPPEKAPPAEGATELDRKSFTIFKQECPKCGFSFDENKESAK